MMATVLAGALMVNEVQFLKNVSRLESSSSFSAQGGKRCSTNRSTTASKSWPSTQTGPTRALGSPWCRGSSQCREGVPMLQCCERYRKPSTAAPAALPQASHVNEKLFGTPKELILMKVVDGYMKTSPTFWPSSTFSTLLPLATHIPEWVLQNDDIKFYAKPSRSTFCLR